MWFVMKPETERLAKQFIYITGQRPICNKTWRFLISHVLCNQAMAYKNMITNRYVH